MNKNVFQTGPLSEDGNDYWKDKPFSERLNALETLRRIMFNYDESTCRLQRTLTITELKQN